jgi:hypothetical protein
MLLTMPALFPWQSYCLSEGGPSPLDVCLLQGAPRCGKTFTCNSQYLI